MRGKHVFHCVTMYLSSNKDTLTTFIHGETLKILQLSSGKTNEQYLRKHSFLQLLYCTQQPTRKLLLIAPPW